MTPHILALTLALLSQAPPDAAPSAAGSASTPAPAAGSPAQRAATLLVQKDCAADTRTLCANVQPGGGRVMQCFRERYREVSPLCKAALGELRRASRGA